MTEQAQEKEKDISFWQVLVFAFSYWKKQKTKLAIVGSLIISGALLETYLPTCFADLIEAVRNGGAASAQTLHALGVFFLVYFGMIFVSGAGYLLYNMFETRLFKQLIDDLFIHIHRLSERFFVNAFAGSIISKINRARNKIESFEDKVLLEIIPTAIILIGSAFFLAQKFPLLALGFFFYVLFFLAASVFVFMKLASRRQAAYAQEQDRTTARLADSITGIATTKAYAQEESEIEGFQTVTGLLRRKNRGAYVSSNIVWQVQQVLLAGLLVLLLGGGVWLIQQGKAEIEDLAYLFMAYTVMRGRLHAIAHNLKDLMTASYELHAAIRLLREVPDVKDAPEARPLEVRGGAIVFSDISFAYPSKEQPVFSDFSLSIKAGESVALVGPSGSGKTSLIRLVQRLYDVQKGVIEIDGQDLALCTQKSLRRAIGVVPQDPILFHRSIKDNIAYARAKASFEEVREAARRAYIHDFIESLPEGYDTLVGERGIKLSGGERQRVAIARALLADRPILILDEATSSLDTISEQKIRLALRELIKDRTSIMVAHRLSTVIDADRILVFDNGAIVEAGTHAQLLACKGIYARLFALQSGGFFAE